MLPKTRVEGFRRRLARHFGGMDQFAQGAGVVDGPERSKIIPEIEFSYFAIITLDVKIGYHEWTQF